MSAMLFIWLSLFSMLILKTSFSEVPPTTILATKNMKKTHVRKEGLFCLVVFWCSLSWPGNNGGEMRYLHTLQP